MENCYFSLPFVYIFFFFISLFFPCFVMFFFLLLKYPRRTTSSMYTNNGVVMHLRRKRDRQIEKKKLILTAQQHATFSSNSKSNLNGALFCSLIKRSAFIAETNWIQTQWRCYLSLNAIQIARRMEIWQYDWDENAITMNF